jgi:hypothetical protein
VRVTLFFLILMRRDLLRTTLLGRLLLRPIQGSLVIRIHATTGVPLVSTHRAAVQTALQVLILAPI